MRKSSSKIIQCVSPELINSTYGVMKQLRPKIGEDYCQVIQEMQHIKNYQLLGCFKSEGECIGAIGYTPDYRLSVGGKMIYINDLVVDERLRG